MAKAVCLQHRRMSRACLVHALTHTATHCSRLQHTATQPTTQTCSSWRMSCALADAHAHAQQSVACTHWMHAITSSAAIMHAHICKHAVGLANRPQTNYSYIHLGVCGKAMYVRACRCRRVGIGRCLRLTRRHACLVAIPVRGNALYCITWAAMHSAASRHSAECSMMRQRSPPHPPNHDNIMIQ